MCEKSEYMFKRIYVEENDDLQLSGRVSKYLCNNRKSSYGKRTDRKGESERRKVNKAKYASGPK